MVLTNKIEIRINPSNINHYNNYYDNLKVNELKIVNVKYLTKGSKYKIKMRCDKCYSEYNIAYNILHKNNSLEKFICKNCKRKKTTQQKYGVNNIFQLDKIKDKSKNTIKEKYGVDNISQSPEIKSKKINTFIEKYGVKWGLSSDEIKEKSKKTIQKKYNVNNISKLEHIKRKKEETCFINYGVNFISQHKDFKKNINKNLLIKLQKKYKNLINCEGDKFIFYCDICDKEFEIYKKSFYTRYNLQVNICTFCNPIGSVHSSIMESMLYDFITKHTNYKCNKNYKNIINPYELDIYIPELKIAFEFNGLYWHNELYKDKNYHLNKTEECEKKGIQLIHIWEDDWKNKQEIVKSIILNKLYKTPNKIYARKTEIKKIVDNKLVRKFLDKNHIQGFVGSKIKLGLFFDNELISLMTFGKRRVAMGKKSTNENEYELLRFCNKLNTNVIGGASKLFKYFIRNYNPEEITTYADRGHSNGNLYKTLEFESQGKTQPNYYYIIDSIRKHRFNYRKDKLIKEGFDPNKTEHQIMLDRNIFRIYDSGNLKFSYK